MTARRNLRFLIIYEVLLGILVAIRSREGFDGFYMPAFLAVAAVSAASALLTGESAAAPFTLCTCMLLVTGAAAQAVCGDLTCGRYLKSLGAAVLLTAAFLWIYFRLLPKIRGGYFFLTLLCGILCCGICLALAAAKALTGSAVQPGIGGFQLCLFAVPAFAVYLGTLCTSALPEKLRYLLSVIPAGVCGILLLYISELGTLMMLCLLVLLAHYLSLDRAWIALLETALLILAVLLGLRMLRAAAQVPDGKLPEALLSSAASLLSKIEGRLSCGGDLSQAGYQLRCAVEAISLGGFLGTNYDVYVPVASSDMIFSSVCLRFGFVLGVTVLLCFVRMLSFMKTLAGAPVRDRVKVTAVLLLVSMCVQSIYNITAACGFLPIVGLPCAFLSLSGSYLVICVMTCGFLTASVKQGEKCPCATSKEE